MLNIIHMRLTIDVGYNLNNVSKETIKKILHNAANHLAGEGLLTGETDALVTDWQEKVEEINYEKTRY